MSPPEPTEGPDSYSTAYVARRMGLSVPTVQRWVDSGQLQAWKTPGGHRRIDARSADLLFEARQRAPVTDAGDADDRARSTVVIIDDNPDDRDVLQVLAGAALPQARIAAYDSGIQALVAIGRLAPDVVITDIVMPGMNGIEVVRQLAGDCIVQPRLIVAVSSLTPTQLQRLGELPPGVVFVPKPVEPSGFVALLRTAA